VLRTLLTRGGYDEELTIEDYPIRLSRSTIIRADIAAFVRPEQRDMSTAAIMGALAESDEEIRSTWLPAATWIAAPAALFVLPDRVALWRVSTRLEDAYKVADATLAEAGELVGRIRRLDPESVYRMKAAGLQLALFPADLGLLEYSRKRARDLLTEHVEAAVLEVEQYTGGRSRHRAADLSPRLVIAALAALMVRDKSRSQPLQGGAVVDIAAQRFPSYFSWLNDISEIDREALDQVVRHLSGQVNFASLEPSMVSDVYERALISTSRRREQGTYYTPPELARQILQVVPIEALEPSRRSILDPACGSGTLLLAASSRLEQLQPFKAGPQERHDYLVSHLRGYDQDTFAVEISKLALLMTALPIGNSWNIEARDALATTLSNAERPSLVVSNPPWGYRRTPGRRIERANDFLRWMIHNLRPGGFLACVLPVSWLNSVTSRPYRELLLEQCTLLEAWELPEITFAATRSSAAPAIVLAQKHSNGNRRRPVLMKRVASAAGLRRFLQSGIPDYALLTSPSESGEGLLDGPLHRGLRDRGDLTPLAEAAEVVSGCAQLPGRPPRDERSATHWQLDATDLSAFGVVHDSPLTPVRYPEDFWHINRSDRLVSSPKVLASAKRSTVSPWRVKAGLDLRGVVPRETLYMVVPMANWPGWRGLREQDRLYALLAILGSGLAACWIAEVEPRRNISAQAYRTVPVPRERGALKTLADAARRVVKAKATGGRRLAEAATALEDTVKRAYRLSDGLADSIRGTLAGVEAPEGVLRYPPNPEADELPLVPTAAPSYGTVVAVAPEGLRVWVSGVTEDDGAWIGVPRRAPGWLCEAGKDFVVSGDLNDLADARFGPHVYDWLREDRLAVPYTDDGG
jgi:SAM-dependent methyltransferase